VRYRFFDCNALFLGQIYAHHGGVLDFLCEFTVRGGDRLGLVFGIQPGIADQMSGTFGRALAAGDTLGVVDHGHIVHHMDGVMLTGLFADPAANTADIAVFPQGGALLGGGTGDGDIGAVGDLYNQVLGAGIQLRKRPLGYFTAPRGVVVMAPKGQAASQEPKPRQPWGHSLGPPPGSSAAERQSLIPA